MAVVLAAIVFVLGLSLSVEAQDASIEPIDSPSPALGNVPGGDPLASPMPGEGEGDHAAPLPSPPVVTVEAGDVWYLPTEVSIDADQETVLALTGVGLAAHNLMIDELGLQLHVGPGITSEAMLSDLPPGTYTFYCSIYGHARAGMVGTLTVE
jgi:plastocyanin